MNTASLSKNFKVREFPWIITSISTPSSLIYDQKISTALQLIHAHPENDWSLESLSKEAGMSRTSFANHFRDKVGQTPMHYITNWRMLIAQRILKESHYSIAEIAKKVGYSSEPAFNRAFKKYVSQTPARYRRSFAA